MGTGVGLYVLVRDPEGEGGVIYGKDGCGGGDGGDYGRG